MAFEADSSLLKRSAIQDLSQIRTRGPSAYTTWIHSRTACESNREDPKLKYYIYYIIILIYRTLVITNMQKHLLSKHQIIIKQDLSLI